MHILDLVRQQMQQNTSPTPPTPTEKAQIVITFRQAPNGVIVRFNSVKKAEKAHKAVIKAWDLSKAGAGPHLHDLDGDMFVTTVDLSEVVNIAFVDIAKYAKFVPIPA